MSDSLQFKAMSGQLSIDEAQGIVECFVAAVGNKDSVGDIVMPGAFNSSLKRRKPRVVWGHDWNKPIGKVLDMYEVPASDPRLPAKMKKAGVGGLFAKVQFNLRSERGREAFNDILFFGEEQEWSIGYKTLDSIYSSQRQANLLKELELYEVSPVLHGANQLTATISIKSEKQDDEDRVDSFRKSQWDLFDPEFAEMIKEKYPSIWAKGGNIRGNDQYAKLLPIAKRGGKATSETEINALELREAWVARHKQDFRLPGVVAQIKWLAVGSRGEGYMKDVIREAIAKLEAKNEKGDDAMKEMAEGLMEFIADRYGDKYSVSIEDDKDYDEDYEEDDYGDDSDEGFRVNPEMSMSDNLAEALAEEYGGPVEIRDMSRNTVVFDHMHDGEIMTMRASWHSERGLIMVGSAEEVRAETVYIPVEDDYDDDEEYGSEAPDVPGPGAGMAGGKDCGCGCGGKGMCGVKQIAGRLGGGGSGSGVDRDRDGLIFDGTDREMRAPSKNKRPRRNRNADGTIDNAARTYAIDKYRTRARIEEDGSGYVELRDGGRYAIGGFDDPNALREVPSEFRKRVQMLRKYQNQRNMLALRESQMRRRGKKVAYGEIMDDIDLKVGRTVAGRNMERLRDAINLLTEILNEGDASVGLERKGDDYLVLGTSPDAMFGLKALLDPIAEYHGAEMSLDTADGSWIAIKADSQDLIDAVTNLVDGHGEDLRVKSLGLYGTEDGDAVPFELKSLSGKLRDLADGPDRRGGRGVRSAGRKLRQASVDPNARDADGDGVLQEGTTAMRNVTEKPKKPDTPSMTREEMLERYSLPEDRFRPIGSKLPPHIMDALWGRTRTFGDGGGNKKPPTPPKPPAGDAPEPPKGRAAKLLNGLPSPDEFKGMKRGSGPLGSQGGRWYTDDKGQRYLVKPAKSESHAQNEMAAHLFYKQMGLPTDETGIYEQGGLWYIAKKAVQDKDGKLGKPIGDGNMTPELQEQAREGFAADALASSWDVFGLVGDNVITDDDGKIHRIDVGGSMQYRAMGGDKNTFNPGEPWTEPFSMRSSDQGREFYGDMSDDEAYDRLKDLESFDIKSYDDAMKAAGIDEATRTRITETMRDRIDNQLPGILDQLTPEDEAFTPTIFDPVPSDPSNVARNKRYANEKIAELWEKADNERLHKDAETARRYLRNSADHLFLSADKRNMVMTSGSNRRLDMVILRRDGENLEQPEFRTYRKPLSDAQMDEVLEMVVGPDGRFVSDTSSTIGSSGVWGRAVDDMRAFPDGLFDPQSKSDLRKVMQSNFVTGNARSNAAEEWRALQQETAEDMTVDNGYISTLAQESGNWYANNGDHTPPRGVLDFDGVLNAVGPMVNDDGEFIDPDDFEEYRSDVELARNEIADLLKDMNVDISVLDGITWSDLVDMEGSARFMNMKGRLLTLLAQYNYLLGQLADAPAS